LHKLTMTKEEVYVIMSFLDKDYREIITRAVCGKGREFTKETHHIMPSHKPTSILGCWIINHLYNAEKCSKDSVRVRGSYDINVWYSFNDNTKTEVVTETVKYSDEIKLKSMDDNCLNDDYDVVANVTQQPNCLECKIKKNGNKIAVDVEREFVVEVIGDTKVLVKVERGKHDRRSGEWDYREKDRGHGDFIKGNRK